MSAVLALSVTTALLVFAVVMAITTDFTTDVTAWVGWWFNVGMGLVTLVQWAFFVKEGGDQ